MYATLNGDKIYYEDLGEGYPLVFLHPWPTDHAMWMLQIPYFSENYRVITPDSLGLGASDKPTTGYSHARLSDHVEALLDHLGIEKAFVVGNSLGGAVAEKFTIDHPRRVQATVWIGAPTSPWDEMTVELEPGKVVPFANVYLDALRVSYSHFWKTIWKPTMHYQFHEDFVNTNIGSYLIRYLFEERYARLNSDARGVIGILEGLRREQPLERRLSQSEIPAAIVTGDGDDTRPYCEFQHKAVPKTELLVIKKSAHFCYMDNAEVFNRFLSNFLRQNAP